MLQMSLSMFILIAIVPDIIFCCLMGGFIYYTYKWRKRHEKELRNWWSKQEKTNEKIKEEVDERFKTLLDKKEKEITAKAKKHEQTVSDITGRFSGYLKILDDKLDERYEKIAEKMFNALKKLSREDRERLKS